MHGAKTRYGKRDGVARTNGIESATAGENHRPDLEGDLITERAFFDRAVVRSIDVVYNYGRPFAVRED